MDADLQECAGVGGVKPCARAHCLAAVGFCHWGFGHWDFPGASLGLPGSLAGFHWPFTGLAASALFATVAAAALIGRAISPDWVMVTS